MSAQVPRAERVGIRGSPCDRTSEAQGPAMTDFHHAWVLPVLLAVYLLLSGLRVLREYERAVIFRLGRLATAVMNPGGSGTGPGLVLLLPILDRMVRVSLQVITSEVPAQEVITWSRGVMSRSR
jgi:hypothetical protein